MFDPSSRYYSVETAIYRTPDGREIRYKRRRFLPPGEALPTLVEITVEDGDRLDLIAAANIAAPEQYWRICDAQDAMHPAELTATPGRRLRIPIVVVNR